LPKFPISVLGLPPKHVPRPGVKLAPQPTLQSGMITLPLVHLFCSLVFGLPQSGVIDS